MKYSKITRIFATVAGAGHEEKQRAGMRMGARIRGVLTAGAIAVLAFSAVPGLAYALTYTIDFDADEFGADIVHGQVINDEYGTIFGVGTSAVNVGGGAHLAVAFDTTLTGTRDPDLEDPWTGGNLPTGTDLGNILIIQENSIGCADGICNYPDDEGSRPAGSIYFDFANPITSFGFDLVDVEGDAEYGNGGGYFAAFYNADNEEIGHVGFEEFVSGISSFFDSTVGYGNNSANRIQPIYIAELEGANGITDATRVEISMGGSGGIDNITYTQVSEPGTLVLFGLGLAGLGFTRRRRRAA